MFWKNGAVADSTQVCGVSAICSWKRCTRRDLPIPASPMISADLAFALERALPAIHQQAQFVLAPDERSQSTRRGRRFEPPAHSAGLDYPVKLDRPFDSLERLRAAILDHEQPGDQPMRRVGDQHRAGFRGRLHPRRDIGRVAEYIGILARACAHHHRARIDADSSPRVWSARGAR